MGQQEVYDFLKRYKKNKFTTSMLSKLLKCSRGAVTACCSKLKKTKFIKSESDKKHENKLWYWVD